MNIQVVFNQAHPPAGASLTATFTNSAPRLFLLFSGSAWTQSAPSLISADLFIDGSLITSASVWANENTSHKALVSAAIVTTLTPGQHTVTVQPTTANTIIDHNDVFTLSVIEFP